MKDYTSWGVEIEMNKKDIAAIRKQFKLDTDLLKITDIYKVYIKQESSEFYHEESQPFALLDREQQELFLTNFKKVLGGKLGLKLFEVKFQQQAEEQTDHTQRLLYEGLHTNEVEEWKTNMESIARKMVQDAQYEKDVVVTFIRGNYYKPTKINELFNPSQTEIEKVKVAFEFVRDEISHSWDIQGKRVTCSASDVLTYKEGICYAKSHLVASLLRSQGIPTGFCYQRLMLFDTPEKGYCIHALNAVFLKTLNKWQRLDARGSYVTGQTYVVDGGKDTI